MHQSDYPQPFDVETKPSQRLTQDETQVSGVVPTPAYLGDSVPESRSETGFSARVLHALRDILETVIPAIIIALLINLFLAQATRVYGQSMEPNLHTDQRLVVEKVSYHFHAPRRGDVVVLKVNDNAEDLLIKRVIALPGETVEIKDGRVYVDGVALEENYLAQPTRGHQGPIYVGPLQVFVLGDNRSASNDSRAFGTVSMENIVGRAWFSYWPAADWGLVD